ncbi:hypothetical protein H0Z60_06360 [Ectothiorhodospiraceae bacterium WFHF3C12]|nr:hypothetical protein [Ectothiorhodospiraceae bacterium WFHF3C12]
MDDAAEEDEKLRLRRSLLPAAPEATQCPPEWSATIVPTRLALGPPSWYAFYVIEHGTRAAVAVQVDVLPAVDRLIVALESLSRSRGAPRYLELDDGCPMAIDPLSDWCARVGIRLNIPLPGQGVGKGGFEGGSR